MKSWVRIGAVIEWVGLLTCYDLIMPAPCGISDLHIYRKRPANQLHKWRQIIHSYCWQSNIGRLYRRSLLASLLLNSTVCSLWEKTREVFLEWTDHSLTVFDDKYFSIPPEIHDIPAVKNASLTLEALLYTWRYIVHKCIMLPTKASKCTFAPSPLIIVTMVVQQSSHCSG